MLLRLFRALRKLPSAPAPIQIPRPQAAPSSVHGGINLENWPAERLAERYHQMAQYADGLTEKVMNLEECLIAKMRPGQTLPAGPGRTVTRVDKPVARVTDADVLREALGDEFDSLIKVHVHYEVSGELIRRAFEDNARGEVLRMGLELGVLPSLRCEGGNVAQAVAVAGGK